MVMLTATAICLSAIIGAGPKVMGADGRLHAPLSESVGKPVVLLFISHDCPVCNTYAPEIGRLEEAFAGRVQFDLVYCDLKLSASDAREHAKQFSIDRSMLLLDPTCKLATYSKAKITPQAVVYVHNRIAYSGRIDDRYFAIGQQRPAPTSHDLSNAIKAVLNHRSAPEASGPPIGCFIVFPNLK